jgi:hypothetical protein
MFANFRGINNSISSCAGISSNDENVTSLVRSISDISFEDKISPEPTPPRPIISDENDLNMIKIYPSVRPPRSSFCIKDYIDYLISEQNKLRLRKKGDHETDSF